MKILAIESSCDETAAAVIEDETILSNIISTQAEIHAQYGGVVPEVAARSHIEVIIPVVEQALEDAKTDWEDIDAIAVTKGPGLLGSLLIGVMSAKTLALTKNKPLIGVNHIWAHGFAGFLDTRKPALSEQGESNGLNSDNKPKFPFLALTVSGGHTTLSLYKEDLTRDVLGETLDDAAGEAFDKVAKLLGLGYPGGPAISEAATTGDDTKYKFPVAKLGKESLDFSFSGLKTSVLRQVQQITGVNPASENVVKTYKLDDKTISDIAASFQKAVITALVTNTIKANARYKPKSIVVGGGVACNKLLREEMHKVLPGAIFVPPILCTDNAAMIGALALKKASKDMYEDWSELKTNSSLEEI